MDEKRQRVEALLGSLAEARAETERLERRIEALRGKCCRITPSYVRRAGAAQTRGKAEVWDLLMEEQERLAEQLQKLLTVQRQVEAWINLLPKDRWRMVLRYRYLEGMSFVHIGETLERATGRPCSDTQLYRLHREALQAAAELWPMEAERS